MEQEGVVGKQKEVSMSDNALRSSYLNAHRIAVFGINSLGRKSLLDIGNSETDILVSDLSDDIDNFLGNHPYKEINPSIVEKDISMLKNDIQNAVKDSEHYKKLGLAERIFAGRGHHHEYETIQPGIKLTERAKLVYKAKELADFVDADKTQPIPHAEPVVPDYRNHQQDIPVVQEAASTSDLDSPFNTNPWFYINSLLSVAAGVALSGTSTILHYKGIISDEMHKNFTEVSFAAALGIPFLAYAVDTFTRRKNNFVKPEIIQEPQIKVSKPYEPGPSIGRRAAIGLLSLGTLAGLVGDGHSEIKAVPARKNIENSGIQYHNTELYDKSLK